MAEYTHTESIAAPADKQWATVRNFGDGTPMGAQFEVDGEGVGATRTIAIGGGASIVERCERLDDGDRVLGYTITEGPLPFDDYHSTMTVEEAGDASTLVWTARYEPKGDADQAAEILKSIYANGAAAIKKHVEG